MPWDNYNSTTEITEHTTRTSTMIMKEFEMFRELPKCDTNTKEQMLLENGADSLAQCRVATNPPFVKPAVSAKCSTGRYACALMLTFSGFLITVKKKLFTWPTEPPGLSTCFCDFVFVIPPLCAQPQAPFRFLEGGTLASARWPLVCSAAGKSLVSLHLSFLSHPLSPTAVSAV